MSVEESDVNNVNPYLTANHNLACSFVKIAQPLVECDTYLKELYSKQNALITQIHNENLVLSQVQHNDEIQEVFKLLNLYQAKLVDIKKNIKHLHDWSLKLKKRALKLQQMKERESSTLENEAS